MEWKSIYLNKLVNYLILKAKKYWHDPTNTYFKGQRKNSQLPQYGSCKKKRSEAKLVVLGAVVNVEGYWKYSNIYKGNMVDFKTFSDIIYSLLAATVKVSINLFAFLTQIFSFSQLFYMIRFNSYLKFNQKNVHFLGAL
jgi:transposase